jgi:succinate-semialdehyde dehydrogenase/glutarate-semialdehyde dehydrogenase
MRSILIDGRPVETGQVLVVQDKYSLAPFAEVARADAGTAADAVSAAEAAFHRGPLPPHRRSDILLAAADRLLERKAAVITDMVAETGFTIGDCENEFARCLLTLRLSAEEARRIVGEMVPIASAPGQDPLRLAFTIRMPVGVVAAITPFNAPLNTVAHKIAPALAAGNSVVLKPASYTPLSALHLCEVLHEAGLPPGWLNVVVGGGADVGQALLEDQRVRYYTFTGSTDVGRNLQRHAGLRRTQLELGNISPVIICADADLELAASRCIAAGFRKAGQVCTSVQRIYVDEAVRQAFTDLLVAKAAGLQVGDPRAQGAFVGPMIAVKEAQRVAAWIDEAVAAGADPLLLGARDRAVVGPTILGTVHDEMRIVREELFGPALVLIPFDNLDQAVAHANATEFGLAAGIFTQDVGRILKLIPRMEMGSLHINETSSSRVDLMPYGGVKASGFGQEGPKYAIRDMTEERLVTLSPGS